jgi:ABC-type multidrug transport system fused ATPase/permease subunit
MLRAARKAGLGDLLARPGGLDGPLAEGGRNLSMREHGALSLARILLGRPQLVLLGEALWHLDPAARAALGAHLETCGATVLRHPVLSDLTRDDPMAA